MKREESSQTEQLGHRFGWMCAAANPVLDAVEVEADEFLIVDVGQRVESPQLFDIFTVSCSFVEGSDNAVEGSVRLVVTGVGQPDDDVASVVLFEEER